jgi:putative transcriptional regulator
MGKFFDDLKESLEEVVAYKKGKLTLRSELVEIPTPPLTYKAKDIKKIREKRAYSQGVFAKILNVSPKTIQAWESGGRSPSHSALRLLEIVDKGIFPENTLRKSAC